MRWHVRTPRWPPRWTHQARCGTTDGRCSRLHHPRRERRRGRRPVAWPGPRLGAPSNSRPDTDRRSQTSLRPPCPACRRPVSFVNHSSGRPQGVSGDEQPTDNVHAGHRRVRPDYSRSAIPGGFVPVQRLTSPVRWPRRTRIVLDMVALLANRAAQSGGGPTPTVARAPFRPYPATRSRSRSFYDEETALSVGPGVRPRGRARCPCPCWVQGSSGRLVAISDWHAESYRLDAGRGAGVT